MVVSQVWDIQTSAESEGAEPGAAGFWKGATVEELAEAQGVQPVEDPNTLWGDFWPEDESLDAFVEAIRESRRRDAA